MYCLSSFTQRNGYILCNKSIISMPGNNHWYNVSVRTTFNGTSHTSPRSRYRTVTSPQDLCPARYRFIHICFYTNRRAFRSPMEKSPQFNPNSISTYLNDFSFLPFFPPFICKYHHPYWTWSEVERGNFWKKKKKSKAKGWSTCISDPSSLSMPWVFTASFLKCGIRADNPAGPLLLWNLRLIYR